MPAYRKPAPPIPKSPANPPIRKSLRVKLSATRKESGVTTQIPMKMSSVKIGKSAALRDACPAQKPPTPQKILERNAKKIPTFGA